MSKTGTIEGVGVVFAGCLVEITAVVGVSVDSLVVSFGVDVEVPVVAGFGVVVGVSVVLASVVAFCIVVAVSVVVALVVAFGVVVGGSVVVATVVVDGFLVGLPEER